MKSTSYIPFKALWRAIAVVASGSKENVSLLNYCYTLDIWSGTWKFFEILLGITAALFYLSRDAENKESKHGKFHPLSILSMTHESHHFSGGSSFACENMPKSLDIAAASRICQRRCICSNGVVQQKWLFYSRTRCSVWVTQNSKLKTSYSWDPIVNCMFPLQIEQEITWAKTSIFRHSQLSQRCMIYSNLYPQIIVGYSLPLYPQDMPYPPVVKHEHPRTKWMVFSSI
jgi:hypothetical protein